MLPWNVALGIGITGDPAQHDASSWRPALELVSNAAVVGLVLEATVWIIGAFCAFRVIVRRPFRRELRAHPRLALGVGVVTAIVAVVFAWLAWRWEIARWAATSVVALAIVAAMVRARSAYGRIRGLPPGSLGLGRSLDAIDDRGFYQKASESWGPVFKMSQFHRPVVCITDLATGLEFDHTNGDGLTQSEWSFNRLVPGGYLEYMNGALHAQYRDLLAPAFTRSAVEATRPTMSAIAREQLTALAEASRAEGVHPEPFLLPIPQVSLLRAVLGVDHESPHFKGLREHFTELNRPIELFLPAPRSAKQTYGWLASTVADLVAQGVATPSVLGDLSASGPEVAGDETAIGNLVLMVKEGSIMVRGMLRWVLKMLADHPERALEIRAARGDERRLEALTTAFAKETIRLHESPYLYRTATRELRLGDFRIPKGWLVRLCLAEAHADRAKFAHPERFDPERFEPGSVPEDFVSTSSTSEPRFCPFGQGRHACLGADVAIEIAKAVIREAALGYDIRVVDDGPAWRINRHWGLWRPSLRMKLVFEPVEA